MEINTRFFELILQCPFEDPTNECVFNKYREMPLYDLIEESRSMSYAEKDLLLSSHNECQRKRKQCKIAG